ncbi:MAG: MAPEG family protein [Burkholderiaceae bacterium]|nr:MAPEG family protein [Burkholderiaceae bacterium]
MTLANTAILIACLLPIVCALLAKAKGFSRIGRSDGYDNNNPRAWLAKQSGWQERANAAQANSFEALPLFIAGVLVAQQMHAPQELVNNLALGFVAARVVYIGLYVANLATLRSLVWGAGLACSVALFFIG